MPAEHTDQAEQRSSVKITRNAKGAAQFEVKVYEETTGSEMNRIREIAVAQYNGLVATFTGDDEQPEPRER